MDKTYALRFVVVDPYDSEFVPRFWEIEEDALRDALEDAQEQSAYEPVVREVYRLEPVARYKQSWDVKSVAFPAQPE